MISSPNDVQSPNFSSPIDVHKSQNATGPKDMTMAHHSPAATLRHTKLPLCVTNGVLLFNCDVTPSPSISPIKIPFGGHPNQIFKYIRLVSFSGNWHFASPNCSHSALSILKLERWDIAPFNYKIFVILLKYSFRPANIASFLFSSVPKL